MDGIVTWILGTSINAWVLNTPWAWPIMETLHFMGLSILLGSMLIIDIRLAGYWRGIAVSAVHRLLPWAVLGFGINLITGVMFFFGDPERYVANIGFKIKMVLVVIAGLNAIWFKLKIDPDMANWSADQDSTAQAKAVAYISLISWFGVLLFGRLIPYIGTG
jgi:hypothetical protein